MATQVTDGMRKDLLKLVGMVAVPATDKFVADMVEIKLIGAALKGWFRDKVEEPAGKSALCYYEVLESSPDDPIIVALGGEEKAETTLAAMFVLLGKQRYGEDGVLLTNGNANIFYIRDVNGVLRVVLATWTVVEGSVHDDWPGDGWYVSTDSLESRPWRYDGLRVFSPQFLHT